MHNGTKMLNTKAIPGAKAGAGTVLASTLLALWMPPAMAADYEHQVNADPHGTVEITGVSGEITVSAWDRAEVRVEAHLGNDAQRVEVVSEPGRTLVKVVMPGFDSLAHAGADLRVSVPRGSRLDVSSVSAGVSVTGVQGDQHLRSVSGLISTDFAGADAEFKTVSGDLHLRGSGQQARVRASSISGDMRLEHMAGDVEAGTVSGGLQAQVNPARALRLHTTSGSIHMEGALAPGARLDAQTLSGELVVRAGGTGGYQYEASTFSGHISNCFNVEAERTGRYGPGQRLQGTLGAGNAQVSLKSLSGTVTLCDH